MSEPDAGRPHDRTISPEPGTLADARAEGHRIAAWVRRNRTRLEILAIGTIALGGIVCMVVVTLLMVWRQANP